MADVVVRDGNQAVRLCGEQGAEVSALSSEEAAPDERVGLVNEARDAGFTTCSSKALNQPTQICSPPNESQGIQLAFINTCSDGDVEFFWVNRDCKEIKYGAASPGQIFYISTYVGHPWRVRQVNSGVLVGELTPTLPISMVSPTCRCEGR